MTTADISEAGLERLIVHHLTAEAGYTEGASRDYDREHAVDVAKLRAFLEATQPRVAAALNLDSETSRLNFLHRLQGEITKRGVVDVLLTGVQHNQHTVELFFGTPTPGNTRAAELHAQNIFSVTRQLRYSRDDTRNALDLALFVNGLPVATFELKNRLTKQTTSDAIQQYKRDRDPRELIFQPGRCAVHFAVDDTEVYFCTRLAGPKSWFLPFNKGWNDGAGNPPNPNGLKTDYLWRETLTRSSLTDIFENYARVVVEKDPRTRKKSTKYIFPRYHQLTSVRALLAHTLKHGAGQRYLIQHSAGSGKSYSITWLAHQLVDLKQEDGQTPVVDTIFVVTDRTNLDEQIRRSIRQFTRVSAIVGTVTRSGGSKSKQLAAFLEQGKKLIICTIQTFPFVLDKLSESPRDKRWAIIIDEAHSSQGGKTAAAMNTALSGVDAEDDESPEDRVARIMEGRKMLPNASYFAFTATPKNKTEELFGTRQPDGSFRPFHSYTMKQAIDEGFIRDVLKHYTPIKSLYHIIKTVEEDPEFDVKKAQKRLRHYVEGHDTPLREKAQMMLEHFHRHVYLKRLVGGEARAMIATDGVNRAIAYFVIIRELIAAQKLPFKAIVAFSGEREYEGLGKVSEAKLNGFPSGSIHEKLREDPYRLLIVADKFQTGFDEPLLQTMYVDKVLSDIKAVQTLSRLNRAHPDKEDVFVLDFANDIEVIRAGFERYYRTTVLSQETDRNKLHDLKSDLDGYRIYSWQDVDELVNRFLSGASRDALDPLLDGAVQEYLNQLDEEEQVDFKSKAKAFRRTYNFLAAIIEFAVPDWEKLSIFLNFLIPKLPAPKEEDLSKGIIDTIDMDSYRLEAKAELALILKDEEALVEPSPVGGGAHMRDAEFDRLSNIVRTFNDLFGGYFDNPEEIEEYITEALPQKLREHEAYQNAVRQGDRQNARIELNSATLQAIVGDISSKTQVFKQFTDNPSFNKWLLDEMFKLTFYEGPISSKIDEGWPDMIELLEPFWHSLAQELAEAGVPVPFEVEGTITAAGIGTGVPFIMEWRVDDCRAYLVEKGTEVEGADGVLVTLEDPQDVEEVVRSVKTVLKLQGHP